MNGDEVAYIEDRIGARLRDLSWSGTVTEKLTDPLRLMVSRGNFYTAVACVADVGTWGQSRVGDLVAVRVEAGVNVAMPPADRAGRPANVLGEDLSTEETTSHTTYVTLLEVDDLYVPAGVPFSVQWKTEIETVGSAGGTAKQVRLVFNGTDSLPISLLSSSGLYWIPVMVSSNAPGLSSGNVGRQVFLLTSDPPSLTLITDLGIITTVAVQARTNDTGGGDDIVRATDLVVSL